jgi:hypothetical protein
MAPDATDDGRRRFDLRRRFGITSFGTNAYRAPSEVDVIREHDEMLLGEAGQEELYIVLNGTATFEIDGDTMEAPAGSLVLVQPTAKRKATAKDDGTTILAIGGTPGKPYEPAPEEAAEAFGLQRGRLRDRCRQTAGRRRETANDSASRAACAGTGGKADEAIEHLQRAVG